MLLIVCLAVGIGLVLATPKKYQATAQVFVSTATASDPQQLAQGNTFAEARVQSYTDVATSPSVTSQVIKDLGLSMTNAQLAGEVSADAPVNKVLINLHVTDRSPGRAATVANDLARVFSSVVQELEQTNPATASPIKLTVTQPANVPTGPVSPRVTLDMALAAVMGLVLGIGLALLRENLDRTFKTVDDLTRIADIAVMGVVPWDKKAPELPVAFRGDPLGSRTEAFRHVRTNLQFVDVDNPPRVIAVTSAMPSEGKTHTALNLAASLAEAGQRVCLVDADLRRPSVAGQLGLVGDVGLTSVLIGKARAQEVLQNVGRNFAVLTAGVIPPNPSELLVSEQFRRALADISTQVDTIVIDTAPLLPVADGAEVAALADATLLTVRANKTTDDQFRRAMTILENVSARAIGIVLNMAPVRRAGGYQYYYDYYRSGDSRDRAEASPRNSTSAGDDGVAGRSMADDAAS